jgi:hypothetical protein
VIPRHFESKERLGKVCVFRHGVALRHLQSRFFLLFYLVLPRVNRAKAVLVATPYTW